MEDDSFAEGGHRGDTKVQEMMSKEEIAEEQDFDVLPVESYKDELMHSIEQNQVIICQGETGSGKTTKIPQFLMDSPIVPDEKMIAITQPRRIAAITVAQRVADERGYGRVGDEVGYCVRFDDCTSARTRAKFMTDGILVRECLSDPALSKYQAVMLDEAHERSIHTDILFGLVKKACEQRSDLKVIVTSATLNEQKFSAYFNDCPVINIPGRLFHVDLYHSKVKQVMTASGPSNSSYVESCVKTVLKIHDSPEKGHILVFLTGSEEIEKACDLLRRQLNDREQNGTHNRRDELVVIPLYASLSPQEQRKAFVSYRGKRKCIIATNIAETSVTVPGIRFVVDPGYVKQKCYDPSRRIESLLVVPISKVAAQQRAGRAGRTGPGQCYRLYSSECYSQFGVETIPEIMRCNLSNTLLYLKVLGIQDVIGFDFMDSPSPEQLSEGLVMLHMLGALNDRGEVTTPVGQGMAIYPLEPCLSRMLIEAARPTNNCLDDLCIIAAMLSVEEIFHFPKRLRYNKRNNFAENKTLRQQEEEDDQRNAIKDAHDRLRHKKGDHFTYLKIFKKYDREDGKYDWCEKNFIKYRAMKTAFKIRSQLMAETSKVETLFSKTQLDNKSGHDRSKSDIESAIQRSIVAGLFMNCGRKCANGMAFHSMPMKSSSEHSIDEDYASLYHLKDMLEEVKLLHLHPTAAFGGDSGNDIPDFVVYQDLVHSGRTLMKHVTKVDESTLHRFRREWSFVHPHVLSGRKLKKKKRKVEDVPTNTGEIRREKMTPDLFAVGSSTSKLDDAKARYMKRKLEKGRK